MIGTKARRRSSSKTTNVLPKSGVINRDHRRSGLHRISNDKPKRQITYIIVIMIFIVVSGLILYQTTNKNVITENKIKQNIAQNSENVGELKIDVNSGNDADIEMGDQQAIQVKMGSIDDNIVNIPNNDLNVIYRLYSSTNCDDTNTYIEINMEQYSDKFSLCSNSYNNGDIIDKNIGSIKIISNDNDLAQLNLYSKCDYNNYFASIFTFDECVHLYDWPSTKSIMIVPNQLKVEQKRPKPIPKDKLPPLIPKGNLEEINVNDDSIPSYHIVSSGEMSTYMAFQDQSRYYGFLASNQNKKANFTRLITGHLRDDIAEYIPTFNAPRHPYSKRYGPLNKADVLVKWFESPLNIPNEDIIVVIDPDNFIIRDLSHWVKNVKQGSPVCEAAWFAGNKAVTRLWKEVCLNNCDFELDLCAVPYIVHRNDLQKIVPWFRKYITIMKDKEEQDKRFTNKYRGIQMGWGTEMFGYIFGAAHVGIKHELLHGIQVRDISGEPSKQSQQTLSFIHVGRAWFPDDYVPGKQYWHTEGKGFARRGFTQVWCKCNNTANDILPWPIPENVNFQTFHTLYALYQSRQYFGELPYNEFRKKPPNGYYEAVC